MPYHCGVSLMNPPEPTNLERAVASTSSGGRGRVSDSRAAASGPTSPRGEQAAVRATPAAAVGRERRRHGGAGGGRGRRRPSGTPASSTRPRPASRSRTSTQPIQKLSQTGCVSPTDPTTLAPSVMYLRGEQPPLVRRGRQDPRHGSAGRRQDPRGELLGESVGVPRVERRRRRRQVEVPGRHGDGEELPLRRQAPGDAPASCTSTATTWAGFTYKWDEAQTDATLESADRDEESSRPASARWTGTSRPARTA